MKTYKIKIKAAGTFQNMGKDSYSTLEAAMADLKDIESAFKPHAVFLFCNDRIVCKTGETAGEFRDPFYKMADGAIGLSGIADAKKDAHLAKLIRAAQSAIDEIHVHLNSYYLWD